MSWSISHCISWSMIIIMLLLLFLLYFCYIEFIQQSLSVSISIFAMMVLDCVHPPGNACSLLWINLSLSSSFYYHQFHHHHHHHYLHHNHNSHHHHHHFIMSTIIIIFTIVTFIYISSSTCYLYFLSHINCHLFPTNHTSSTPIAGATALIAIIGGSSVHQMGFLYVLYIG